jgi:ATP/maltotriose-dependent transcriptional regulator MalT
LSHYSKPAILISRTEATWTNDRDVSQLAEHLTSWRDTFEAGDQSTEFSDLLTARERDVLAIISRGFSNKRIARALEISPETVKSHVKHIFFKLAVSTRTEAVFRAGSLGLL